MLEPNVEKRLWSEDSEHTALIGLNYQTGYLSIFTERTDREEQDRINGLDWRGRVIKIFDKSINGFVGLGLIMLIMGGCLSTNGHKETGFPFLVSGISVLTFSYVVSIIRMTQTHLSHQTEETANL